jgi:DNA-binding transcriptional MerR regulator
MRDYTISDAAKQLEVSVHTLRYYEKAGIMSRVHRGGSGARVYSQDDLNFLDVLRCLRITGMPIREMKTFADLVRSGEATIPDRSAMLVAHKVVVLQQQKELAKAMKVINAKIAKYEALQ